MAWYTSGPQLSRSPQRGAASPTPSRGEKLYSRTREPGGALAAPRRGGGGFYSRQRSPGVRPTPRASRGRSGSHTSIASTSSTLYPTTENTLAQTRRGAPRANRIYVWRPTASHVHVHVYVTFDVPRSRRARARRISLTQSLARLRSERRR